MLLEGRAGIVSGVGPGLGRSIALALAREGADVALGARSGDRLARVAAEVQALGRRALTVETDITRDEDCARLVDEAAEAFGTVDVLVNNAFVQPPLERLEAADMETWRDAFDVNVFGSVRMTKAALPALKAQGGAVVFIASMSARRIRERFGVYAATKSALLTTAQTLAREVGRDGVRVNSVAPGYIWGPSLEWYFAHLAEKQGRTPQDVYAEVAAETCLDRIPTADEVADAVVFLCSDRASAITGQALDVNAGHWLH